ncbi:tripartite tricarboxylate transporter substrate binding protein BugE [Orrella sp. JC864]|uniref:Bug family tripartite tricarboxylate transporter substrate binding protein n=1 Tax=Orrella sp. JC864 TaxID=3120298 RepID=UPI0012BD3DC6
MQSRQWLLKLCVAGSAALACVAGAQAAEYPTRPITMIVPFPAGGTTDVLGRLVAERLGAELKQTIVVENRGGAGGSIGSAAIANAKPDGYTIGVATVSTHGINPAVYKNLPFDAQKDFTPITALAAVPNIMAIHPKVPAQNMAEFIELAKKEPGKLSYASAGNGSVSHMMGELFKMASETDLLHVPYRGVGPALNDTLAGQVDVLFDNLPSTLPHAQSGKLRALAVAAPERTPTLPDVPTFAEVGLQAVNDPSWFGLVAPAGLPAPVLEALSKATIAALASPELKERLASLGATPVGNTPEEFAAQIKETIERNARIAQEANVKID